MNRSENYTRIYNQARQMSKETPSRIVFFHSHSKDNYGFRFDKEMNQREQSEFTNYRFEARFLNGVELTEGQKAEEVFYRIRSAENLRGDTRRVLEARQDHTAGSWGPLSDGTWAYLNDIEDIDPTGNEQTIREKVETCITWILRKRNVIRYNDTAKVIWREDAENKALVALVEYN